MDSPAGPLSLASTEARAASVREALLETVNAAPAGALRAALVDAVAGAEDALGPHLALAAARTVDAESRAERAAVAIGLLEAAQRAEAPVHGLDGALATQDHEEATGGNLASGFASAWLRSRSTEIAAELGEPALARQARALGRIADGWILEANDLYDAGRSPERCVEVASATRGSLCSLATALGGLAANLSAEEVEALARYGTTVGIAGKACDDAVALVPALVPSPGRAGDALTRGVYGLPVAHSLQAEPKLADALGGAIKDDDLEGIVARVREAGGPGRTATQCRRLSTEAAGEVEALDAADELAALAAEVAGRCEEAALA